jgi:hypothetical protein
LTFAFIHCRISLNQKKNRTHAPNIKNEPKEEGPFIIPASAKTRSEEYLERMNARRFKGYDSDLKLLEKKYSATIVQSEDYLAYTGEGTFNSSDVGGSFIHNNRSGTTRYFH